MKNHHDPNRGKTPRRLAAAAHGSLERGDLLHAIDEPWGSIPLRTHTPPYISAAQHADRTATRCRLERPRLYWSRRGNGVPLGTRTILSRHGFRRLYQNAAHRARGDLAHLQLRGPHDLRHSFSTWLEDEGIPARVIDELMGHQRSRRGGAGPWQPHRRPLSAHHPRDGCPDRPSGRPPVGARPPDRASDHPQRNWTRAIGSSSEAEVHTGRGNRWWLGIGFERHADQGSTTSRRVVFWKSSGKRPAGVSLRSVLAGGRDRFRTCGLCRVKEAQSPHIQMRHSALHHNVAAQWLWRTEATQCCVWRSEASFLANLWQGRVINQRGGWLAGPTAA